MLKRNVQKIKLFDFANQVQSLQSIYVSLEWKPFPVMIDNVCRSPFKLQSHLSGFSQKNVDEIIIWCLEVKQRPDARFQSYANQIYSALKFFDLYGFFFPVNPSGISHSILFV